MNNMENSELNKSETAALTTAWTTKEGGLSLLALQDFGKFIMNRPEHRDGKIACIQTDFQSPLEVTFFADDPDSSDDVFHIKQNNLTKNFEVTVTDGNKNKLDYLLEEFGLSPIQG